MPRDSRRAFLPVLALALALAACGVEPMAKVSLDIPTRAGLDWKPVRAVVLAGFREDATVKDLALSRDLVEYLRDAIKGRLKSAALSEKPVAWPSAESLGDAEFWKAAVPGPAGTLILTGRASFGQESRRALTDPERREIDEGPFKAVSPWSSRKAFTLKLEVALIEAATGAVAFRREYQETMTTDNARLTADYALYELFGRLRPRLFRALFGSERPQERILLTK